jgi:hypothetical protein
MGLRPTQGDEKRLLSEAALRESAALPFVISTEAQRSGEISVLTPLPGNVFRQSVAQWRDLRFSFYDRQPLNRQRPQILAKSRTQLIMVQSKLYRSLQHAKLIPGIEAQPIKAIPVHLFILQQALDAVR